MTGALDDLLSAGGVRLDVHGPRATVTLSRPESRNAKTPATWRALAAAGEHVGGTDSVRVVVLAAEGTSFSSGLDRRLLGGEAPDGSRLDDLADLDDAGLDAAIAGFQRAFTVWGEIRPVVIAAVQGHAVGAGFQLALAADLRVAADDVMLAMREVSLGLVPDLGGTAALARLVGESRALELCATGRWVEADEALRLGLVNLVVPAPELGTATDGLVETLLAAPETSLAAVKPLLRGAARRAPADQLAAERRAQLPLLRGLFALMRQAGGA